MAEAGRGGGQVTLACLSSLLFLCVTGKAWNQQTPVLQVAAPAEINEINTPAPVQFSPSRRRPRVHITARLYERRADYEADLLPVRRRQSADTVSR